jgi:hypothetical protein
VGAGDHLDERAALGFEGGDAEAGGFLEADEVVHRLVVERAHGGLVAVDVGEQLGVLVDHGLEDLFKL